MEYKVLHIEALIFSAPKPLTIEAIYDCLVERGFQEISKEQIKESIDILIAKYQDEIYSFEIVLAGNGYQFLTKPSYQESIAVLLKQESKRRLSKSVVETLSIIAYKQPVTKGGIEQVRGVNCDYAVKRLLEKELVEVKGRSDSIGKPVLFGTSTKFLEYFGINSLEDLPQPKDFKEEELEIRVESENNN